MKQQKVFNVLEFYSESVLKAIGQDFVIFETCSSLVLAFASVHKRRVISDS